MNSSEKIVSVKKEKDRQALIFIYEESFKDMERVTKIETLVSIERELASYRKTICDEMFKLSKGKW
tara:strand:+ start:341 stop:538 length:198 start_codon:yes stop_codon:yes gene_type:complete